MRIANCSVFYRTDYIIYLYVHCNFICGLSDVIIKHSVSQSAGSVNAVIREGSTQTCCKHDRGRPSLPGEKLHLKHTGQNHHTVNNIIQ